MSLVLNKPQKEILTAEGKNILVSAAAGSGKTFIMTQRILDRVAKKKINLEECLVLTFTNEAAISMKQRLELSLEEKIKDLKEKKEEGATELEALYQAQRSLAFSQISTLHAFCLRLIKDFFYLLPPIYRENELLYYEKPLLTLDPDLQNLLLKEACLEAVEKMFLRYPDPLFQSKKLTLQPSQEEKSKNEKGEAFYTLIDAYAGKNENKLIPLLLSAYNSIRSQAYYLNLLEEEYFVKLKKQYEEIENTNYLDILFRDIFSVFQKSHLAVQELKKTWHTQDISFYSLKTDEEFYALRSKKEIEKEEKNREKNHELIKQVELFFSFSDQLESILRDKGFAFEKSFSQNRKEQKKDILLELWENLHQLSQRFYDKIKDFPAFRKVADKKGKFRERNHFIDLFRLAYTEVHALFYDGKKLSSQNKENFLYSETYFPFFAYSLEEYVEVIQGELPLLQSFAEILKEVDLLYKQKKYQRNCLDFSDYEHFALYLLEKREVQKYYQDTIKEIYIDEYQDTSPIQESLLMALDPKCLFMVGDIKQSIYRFREACPELFLHKSKEFEVWKQACLKKASAQKSNYFLSMKENFRSKKNILASVNGLFSSILQEDFAEISYVQDGHSFDLEGKISTENELQNGLTLHLLDLTAKNSKVIKGDQEKIQKMRKAEQKDYLYTQLAHSIQKLHQEEGIAYKDIAVLARTHASLEQLAVKLESFHLPYQIPFDESFFDHFELQQLESLLRWLQNPQQDYALLSLLYGGMFLGKTWSLEELAWVKYFEHYLSKNSFVYSKQKNDKKLKTIKEASEKKKEDFLPLSKGHYHQAFFLFALAKQESLEDFIKYAEKDKKTRAKAKRQTKYSQQGKTYAFSLENLKNLQDEARAYLDFYEKWSFILQNENLALFFRRLLEETSFLASISHQSKNPLLAHQVLERFLLWVEDLGKTGIEANTFLLLLEQSKKENLHPDLSLNMQQEDCLHLQTFHSSKGLEYKVVYILDSEHPFNESLRFDKQKSLLFDHTFSWMSRPEKKEGLFSLSLPSIVALAYDKEARRKHIAEELRLFYVALTRAKERLYLYSLADLEHIKKLASLNLPTYKYDQQEIASQDKPSKFNLLTSTYTLDYIQAKEEDKKNKPALSTYVLSQAESPLDCVYLSLQAETFLKFLDRQTSSLNLQTVEAEKREREEKDALREEEKERFETIFYREGGISLYLKYSPENFMIDSPMPESDFSKEKPLIGEENIKKEEVNSEEKVLEKIYPNEETSFFEQKEKNYLEELQGYFQEEEDEIEAYLTEEKDFLQTRVSSNLPWKTSVSRFINEAEDLEKLELNHTIEDFAQEDRINEEEVTSYMKYLQTKGRSKSFPQDRHPFSLKEELNKSEWKDLSPRTENSQNAASITGAHLGSILHKLLYLLIKNYAQGRKEVSVFYDPTFLSLHNEASFKEKYLSEFSAWVRKLGKDHLNTKELELGIENIALILHFWLSTYHLEVLDAQKRKQVFVETPFVISFNLEKNHSFTIQGMIDLWYINQKNEVILLDYKTNHFSPSSSLKEIRKTLLHKYRLQMLLYALGLQRALNGRCLQKICLFHLNSQEVILIDRKGNEIDPEQEKQAEELLERDIIDLLKRSESKS